MRFCLLIIVASALLSSCDKARVFEFDHDFTDRTWKVKDIAVFEFEIVDSATSYNVYYRIRNSSDYPYSRIFVNYTLQNSAKAELAKKLISNYLFDQKTGMPLGSSGIGDAFDHQFLLLPKYKFNQAGKYTIMLEQFMRTDTLRGIEAAGIRVEKVEVN